MEAAEVSKLLFLKPSKYVFCISFHLGTLNKLDFQYTAETDSALLRGDEMALLQYLEFLCSSKEGTESLIKCISNHTVVKCQLVVKIWSAIKT